ncbi:MAG: hypothetical protein LBH21_01370 [Gracilibacteraceae bacterium]|nr:hypothetical protein [Gracilibacteraceae bacterium]
MKKLTLKTAALLLALALLLTTAPAAVWADDSARYAAYRIQINEETLDVAQYFLTNENALYAQLDQIAPYLGLNAVVTDSAVTLASEARSLNLDKLRLAGDQTDPYGAPVQERYGARTQRELDFLFNVFLGRHLADERQRSALSPEQAAALAGDGYSTTFMYAMPKNAILDVNSALEKALRAWRLYGTESLYCGGNHRYDDEEWSVYSIYFQHDSLGGVPEANRPTPAGDSAAYIDTVNQLLYYDSLIDRGDAKKAELQKIIMLHDFMGQHLQWDYHNPKIDATKPFYSDAIANGNGRNFENCTPHMYHFAELAQLLGLETGLMRNTHEVAHNWNTVRYGGDWYHIDSRMDDYDNPAPGANTYRYALKSDADLQAAYYIYRGLKGWSGPAPEEENYNPAMFAKSVSAADIKNSRLKIENYPYISNQLVQNSSVPAKPASLSVTLDGTAQNISLYNIGGRLFVKLENIINSAGAGSYTTDGVISVYF